MAVTRAQYQTAHITIVIGFTLFSVTVLGVEHPIVRFVASIAMGLPILWAVLVLGYARVPAETMKERLREELTHRTAGSRYRRISAELLNMSQEAKELDRVATEMEAGRLSRKAGFGRLNQIEQQMRGRVETIGGLAAV